MSSTKNFPQGMTALVAYDPERPIEENEKRMKEAINQVQTGEITYAVRESQYNGLEIQNGELLGIVNANIITKEITWDVAKDLVSSMLDRGGEAINSFYGSDISRRG